MTQDQKPKKVIPLKFREETKSICDSYGVACPGMLANTIQRALIEAHDLGVERSLNIGWAMKLSQWKDIAVVIRKLKLGKGE